VGREGRKMRSLSRGLMVLGLMGIVLSGVAHPANPINKVVIGILDFEMIGTRFSAPELKTRGKDLLMEELRGNARVELVDIGESCGVSELKKNGYERAERYRNNYQLDMILHVTMSGAYAGDSHSYLTLIDLYTKRPREVCVDAGAGAIATQVLSETEIEFIFRGISRKILVDRDLNRVLSAKKEALEKKEVTVPQEVKKSPREIEAKKEVSRKKEVTVPRGEKESPEEIQGFLIQNGPKLIAEGDYNRVLELIEDLPGERRRQSQIQTLACFANLKGWVSRRDQVCKLSWWNLRQNLMHSRDNEATPMLVIFLKDKDPYLRLYAAELLVHIGDKRALKDLRAAGENDENHKVRRYAKKAYEQISGEKF
jgi:hypothetical protein